MVPNNDLGMENFKVFGSHCDILSWDKEPLPFFLLQLLALPKKYRGRAKNIFAHIRPKPHLIPYEVDRKIFNERRKRSWKAFRVNLRGAKYHISGLVTFRKSWIHSSIRERVQNIDIPFMVTCL